MISVKVDKTDPTDLYEQVAAEIRRAIAEGEAKPGERLPPAKDLAAVLGVNTNTVLRSLRLLRDEGLLEFRRGRGISVAGTPERVRSSSERGSSSSSPAARATAWKSWSRSSRASADGSSRATPKYHGATSGPPDPPRWAEITKATIRQKRFGRRDRLGCLGLSGSG